LLEVRPLRDLHPVAPDLPPESPRTERRALPVVLDEADVVRLQVEAHGRERVEVDVENVVGGRLEDHLPLVELLEAKGVLAVAPVAGPDRRLDVERVPRLGPERAEEGRRVERSRADLRV